MTETGMFVSCVRPSGDVAGVFEYDVDCGWFYLYRAVPGDMRVLAGAFVVGSRPDFEEAEVEVRWDSTSIAVGLFIRGVLWAVFDTSDESQSGGNYRPGGRPDLRPAHAAAFAPE